MPLRRAEDGLPLRTGRPAWRAGSPGQLLAAAQQAQVYPEQNGPISALVTRPWALWTAKGETAATVRLSKNQNQNADLDEIGYCTKVFLPEVGR
ncbi:MAG TPA: hypothetical protein VLL08_16785 [Kineosporiaceae bacterium]|nr:hypothetical protein [Kineosporiaceae bacterium]